MTYPLLILFIALSGCGGSNDNVINENAAQPRLTPVSVKTFRFSWTDVSDATHYKLLENPDGVSGFTQVGPNVPLGTQSIDHRVPLYARINAQYILQTCTEASCVDSNILAVSGTLDGSIGYIKASNTDKEDNFGGDISLSEDGTTLAVAASGESSNARDIKGNQSDNSAWHAGAAYVFTQSDGIWSQQAYLKASNSDGGEAPDSSGISAGTGDNFGRSLNLSADGNTLVVSASEEASSSTGINGEQSDNSLPSSGAVYVFTRSGNDWSQQAYVKASNTESHESFGWSVSLSKDGNTLAVGADGEESSAIGINGDQTDNSTPGAGAVYVFTRIDTVWSQQAYLKAGNKPDVFDFFGSAVRLSGDGTTLAVSARDEDSSAVGINVDHSDNSAEDSGAVYVFTRSDSEWSQQAYIKASNADANDGFGHGNALSLSEDGHTLAVGAPFEDSSATGLNGVQSDNSTPRAGAVYVFARSEGNWSQQAYLKASISDSIFFGYSVSLSSGGNLLAIGAAVESSGATGVNGLQNDNSALSAGAAYVFASTSGEWTQQAYLKASNTDENDWFGSIVTLSGDGNTLAVGAFEEDSGATGINGLQSDNSVQDSGAVYLY